MNVHSPRNLFGNQWWMLVVPQPLSFSVPVPPLLLFPSLPTDVDGPDIAHERLTQEGRSRTQCLSERKARFLYESKGRTTA